MDRVWGYQRRYSVWSVHWCNISLCYSRGIVVPYWYTHVALSWLDVGYHATLCIHTYHMYSMPVITCLCLSIPMIIVCRFPGRGTAPDTTGHHRTPPDITGHYRTCAHMVLPRMDRTCWTQNRTFRTSNRTTHRTLPDTQTGHAPDIHRTSPDITGHTGHPVTHRAQFEPLYINGQ